MVDAIAIEGVESGWSIDGKRKRSDQGASAGFVGDAKSGRWNWSDRQLR